MIRLLIRLLFKQPPKRVPLEKQFRALQRCGIDLRPEYTLDMMVAGEDRTTYEEPPYSQLLFTLGTEIEEPPWGRFYSDDVYVLDLECIEGDGSYVEITRQLSRMVKDDLRIEEIKDDIDPDAHTASVTFTLNGEEYRFDAEYNDDWADPLFFDWFDRIVQRQGSPSRFWFNGDGGQAALFVYLTTKECKALKRVTGMTFEPLNRFVAK